MNDTWKNDPRLKETDPRKLALLSSFAEELARAPQARKMDLLFSFDRQAAERGLSFTSAETGLIAEVLAESLSPTEKKQLELIRSLTGAGRRPASQGSPSYRRGTRPTG